ncbi:MAG: hypothetical protein Q7U53_03260 [Anaerolineaceae bacterium]|nr:hypothetical protein [Anaerolineaceae bacterium]
MTKRNRVFFTFTAIFLLGFFFLGALIAVQAAVTLVSFDAFPGSQQVVLEWETASETDMLGFYVTRSNQQNGNYSRVSNFIFTQGTPVSGLIYQYVDTNLTNGQTYYYKLEAVDNNYDSEFFGPVSAIPGSSTLTSTVTQSQTVNLTYSPTLTLSPTITFTPTPNLTHSRTPTFTSTSPFSFFTNTATETATITPLDFATTTETPDLTGSATVLSTRTFEIKGVRTATSTVTVEPESTNPFTLGLIGFGITIGVGIILITVLLIIQRNRKLV